MANQKGLPNSNFDRTFIVVMTERYYCSSSQKHLSSMWKEFQYFIHRNINQDSFPCSCCRENPCSGHRFFTKLGFSFPKACENSELTEILLIMTSLTCNIRKGAEGNNVHALYMQSTYNYHTLVFIFSCLIKIYWCNDISVNNVIKVIKNANTASITMKTMLNWGVNLLQMHCIRLFKKASNSKMKLDKFSCSNHFNQYKDTWV